jgi:hypothetical protein
MAFFGVKPRAIAGQMSRLGQCSTSRKGKPRASEKHGAINIFKDYYQMVPPFL